LVILGYNQKVYFEGGDAWRWRLFAWEEEVVGELTLLLHNVFLQVDKDDRWLWSLDTSKAYTVPSTYNFLITQHPIAHPVGAPSPWHKDVPLKVAVFAWRLFRDRLPTKDNLAHRGVIDNDSRMCVVFKNHPIIYFYIVMFLGLFGTLFISGLALLRSPLIKCRTILINLAIVVVFLKCAVRSFRSFGLLRLGKFGRKEITGSSPIKNAQ